MIPSSVAKRALWGIESCSDEIRPERKLVVQSTGKTISHPEVTKVIKTAYSDSRNFSISG
jgi:hypothetical protein